MTAPTEPTPAAPATVPTPQPVAPAAPAPHTPAAPATFDPASLTPEAQAWLRQQVADADAKARVGSKQNAAKEARDELVQNIGKALGLVDDGQTLDPARLTEQLTTARGQWEAAEESAASLEVERDVIITAVDLGVNPRKLLDSNAFCQQVDNLQFADEKDFATKVEALIKAAADKDPSLRLGGPGPARMGVEPSGGGGGSGQQRPISIHSAISRAYGQGG